MIEIKICRGLRDRQTFFSYSTALGYTAQESSYIRFYLLLNVKHSEMLLATENGVPVGRAYTWQGIGQQGFFACLEGKAEAISILLREITTLNTAWGSRSLYGPLFPDGAGVFMGTCKTIPQGNRGVFTPLYTTEASSVLEKAGFEEACCYNAYELEVPKLNPYKVLAQKAAARYRLSIKRLNCRLPWHTVSDAVYRLEGANPNEAANNADKLKKVLDGRLCACVSDKNGEELGYILCTKGQTPRVMTLITKACALRPMACLLLVSFVTDGMISRGIKRCEISVIDSRNTASIALVKGVKAQLKSSYAEYYKQLT